MEKIKKFAVWQASFVIALVFTISSVIYFYSIQNLEKPASTKEAIHFLFEHTDKYITALFFGGVAKVAMILMVIIAVIITFRFIVDDFVEYSKKFSTGYLLIHWIATIFIVIVQKNIVAYFWVLLGVFVILMFFVYLFINSDS